MPVTMKEKAEPTVAVALVALVTTGAVMTELLTLRVRLAEPVPLAFLALIVALKVPALAGVPLMTPVEVLTERLEGNPVALKLVGELLALMA